MRRARLLLAFAVCAASARAAAQGTGSFPHEKHARVFPVCEGCHGGIVSGDSARMFPAAADCQRCHDGTRVKTVEWSGRAPRVSLLRFSHRTHRDILTGRSDTASCQSCHGVSGTDQRMAVAGPNPDRCLRCHANASNRHIAPDASCRTCHVPVASRPRLTVERLARFPRPAWHEATGFTADHGRVTAPQAGSCAVCHARESCERCHANADRVALIAKLPRDARIATLVRDREAAYVSPASHRTGPWRSTHGAVAGTSSAGCANCHTQSSCTMCHREGVGASRTVIATLPGPGVRRGLGVSRTRGPMHPADIATRHGNAAASGGLTCANCHAERTCAGCHAGQDSPRVHAANFVERHAVDVFSNAADCQSCHNTERFCRDCHTRAGIASSGRMNAAFHTGQPTWVLSHGQAARTGMEACASCHRQADCTRCHSATGGWGVNPHGSGFRAGALGARNAASCAWCHLGPVRGGGN